jgi:hypothetical protein
VSTKVPELAAELRDDLIAVGARVETDPERAGIGLDGRGIEPAD